jgi:hypothetical protein
VTSRHIGFRSAGNAFVGLTWIPQVREAYESAHPDARAVSLELAPLPLADKATRTAYARQGQEAEANEEEEKEEDEREADAAASPQSDTEAAAMAPVEGGSAAVVLFSTEASLLGPPPSNVSMPPV